MNNHRTSFPSSSVASFAPSLASSPAKLESQKVSQRMQQEQINLRIRQLEELSMQLNAKAELLGQQSATLSAKESTLLVEKVNASSYAGAASQTQALLASNQELESTVYPNARHEPASPKKPDDRL